MAKQIFPTKNHIFNDVHQLDNFRCETGYNCVDSECSKCEDIDECSAADHGGCSQLCQNTNGGYKVNFYSLSSLLVFIPSVSAEKDFNWLLIW